MVTPFIYFSHTHFSHEWLKLSAVEVAVEAEKLREELALATDYPWGNTHFVLEASSGQPGLQLQWTNDGAHCDGSFGVWSARTNTAVVTVSAAEFDIDNRLTTAHLLEDWADKAAEGQIRCAECKNWSHTWKHFSYAGSVCLRCFNPKKHLPPDSR